MKAQSTYVAVVAALTLSVYAASGQVPAAEPNTLHSAAATVDAFSPAQARNINKLLAPILKKHGVPALAGAIVTSDSLVAIGAVGVRRMGDETPVTVDDKFHIGSCTKSMTATLLATFVEEGVLSWNTTLEQGLPELAPKMDASYRSVTVAQLLTHRAGIPSDLHFDGLWGKLWNHTGTPTEQRATLAQAVLSRPPEHAPGGKFLYANAGFAIAGYIAEVKSGQGWEELMRQRLFTPLGMTSAGFGSPGSGESIDQPRGHGNDHKPVEPGKQADNPAAIGPGGTVHCSLADWGRFAALHLRGEKADQILGGVTIKRETFLKMHEPVKGQGADYAMGWGVTTRPWAGKPGITLTHSGSNTMWYCVCWLAPEKGFAVLAATNIADAAAPQACDEAASAMIQYYIKAEK